MIITVPIDEECWQPLSYADILPNTYLISNYGKIKFIETDKLVNILQYNDKGYCLVSLRTTTHNKTYSVHRLVAFIYVPGYDASTGKIIVNHRDSLRYNNYYENLEWTTYWNNTIHGICDGNIKGTIMKNGEKLIYTPDFIESICEYIRDGVKAKDICELLKIDDHIIKPVKSLIKDIKQGRTHRDISSLYGIQYTKRNLFDIGKVHIICQLLSEGVSDNDIIIRMEVPDEEIPKYNKVIFNITHKYAFVNISNLYGIQKRERVLSTYSDELVRSVCELFVEGYSYNEIINKLNLESNNKIKSFLSDIHCRHSHNDISKDYVW